MDADEDTVTFDEGNGANDSSLRTSFIKQSDSEVSKSSSWNAPSGSAPTPMKLKPHAIHLHSQTQIQPQSQFLPQPHLVDMRQISASIHQNHTGGAASFSLPIQMSTGPPATVKQLGSDDSELVKTMRIQNTILRWIAGLIIGTIVIGCAILVTLVVAVIVWRDTGTTINNFSESSVPLMSRAQGILATTEARMPEWLGAADGLAKSVLNWTESHSEKLFETMDTFTDDPFAMYNLIFDTLDSAHATISPLQNQTRDWVKSINQFFLESKEIIKLIESILKQTNSVGIDETALKVKEVVTQVFDVLAMWNDFQGFKRSKTPNAPQLMP